MELKTNTDDVDLLSYPTNCVMGVADSPKDAKSSVKVKEILMSHGGHFINWYGSLVTVMLQK